MENVKYTETSLNVYEAIEGEPIEHKVERIISNNEPITDGAPEIFTERKDGVIEAYNIRTDRWEIATNAMDIVSSNELAKRQQRIVDREPIKLNPESGGATSTQATNE